MITRRRAPLGLLPGLAARVRLAARPHGRRRRGPLLPRLRAAGARSARATSQVKLDPCAFSPAIARVPVGATVTFANAGDFTHLVTGANQEWGSRDLEIHPYSKVSYTFDKAGTYPYACALHRGMSGVIVVGDADAAALAAPVASTTAPPAGGTVGSRSCGGRCAAGIAGVLLGAGAVALVLRGRRQPAAVDPVGDARAGRSPRGPRHAALGARRRPLTAPGPGPGRHNAAMDRVAGGLPGAFWRLWVATGASNLADGIVWLLIPVLAVQLGAGPGELALVTIAERGPMLVLGLLAGGLADRHDRRRTMLAVQGLRVVAALVLLAVAFAGTLTIPALIRRGAAPRDRRGVLRHERPGAGRRPRPSGAPRAGERPARRRHDDRQHVHRAAAGRRAAGGLGRPGALGRDGRVRAGRRPAPPHPGHVPARRRGPAPPPGPRDPRRASPSSRDTRCCARSRR